MVVAETRQRPTDPHKEEDKEKGLTQEAADPNQGTQPHRHTADNHLEWNPRKRIPATEEEQHEYPGADRHVHILGDEEERPFELTILGVKTTDQIRFRFRHVEGLTIRLGEKCHQKDERTHRHEENEPHAAEEPSLALAFHHVEEAQRAIAPRGIDPQKYGNDRKGHREFVRYELGRSTHPTEEGILRIRSPTCENQRIHTQRTNREHGQNADIHVGENQRLEGFGGRIDVGAKRHHHDGAEGRNQRNERGHVIVELVYVAGNDILFENEFRTIRHEMEDAQTLQSFADERNPRDPGHNGTIGTGTALNPSGDFTFRHGAGTGDRDQHADRDQTFDGRLDPNRKIEIKINHGSRDQAVASAAAGLKWRDSPSGKSRPLQLEESSNNPVAGMLA